MADGGRLGQCSRRRHSSGRQETGSGKIESSHQGDHHNGDRLMWWTTIITNRRMELWWWGSIRQPRGALFGSGSPCNAARMASQSRRPCRQRRRSEAAAMVQDPRGSDVEKGASGRTKDQTGKRERAVGRQSRVTYRCPLGFH